MLLVVNYHYIRPTFPEHGIRGETPDQFRDQLERLAQIGTFVSGPDIREAALGGKPLPERAILITFDDGLREQYEHAWPILQAMCIPALFFVNTDPIQSGVPLLVHRIHEAIAQGWRESKVQPSAAASEKYPYDTPEIAALKYAVNVQRIAYPPAAAAPRDLYMTWGMLARLSADASLGAHGHTHELPEHGFQQASHLIQRWCGTSAKPDMLSYPFGTLTSTRTNTSGYVVGFTMERGVNADLSRPLMLGRISCADLPDEGPLDQLWELPRCVWS